MQVAIHIIIKQKQYATGYTLIGYDQLGYFQTMGSHEPTKKNKPPTMNVMIVVKKLSLMTKEEFRKVQCEIIRRNDKLIDQNNEIIIQNDRIIQLLEKIAGEQGEVKFAETGEKICPHCKRMNRHTNEYCSNCGTPI